MSKIVTMAGAVLAIVVLATSLVSQSAEAMKVTAKDPVRGLKVRCGVTPQDTLRCDFQSKVGIDSVALTSPIAEDTGGDCSAPVRMDSQLVGQPGSQTYVYVVNDCTGVNTQVDVVVKDFQVKDITIS